MPCGHGDIINIGGAQILKIALQPGCRWSEHVKSIARTELCEAPQSRFCCPARWAYECPMAPSSQSPLERSRSAPSYDTWSIGDEPVVAIDCAQGTSGRRRRNGVRARHPGVDVPLARAEAVPFEDGRFDVSLARLVLYFVTEPEQAARELRRVVRPGGFVVACVGDFAAGMEMSRHFWDAALTLIRTAGPERTGLEHIVETTL